MGRTRKKKLVFIDGTKCGYMAKQIGCKDVGVDCEWSATAGTVDELMEKIRVHAKEGHGFDPIPEERVTKILANIKDV